MTPMLENIARAIARAFYEDEAVDEPIFFETYAGRSVDALVDEYWAEFTSEARAALLAISEPTEAMVSAFWASPAVNGPDDAPEVLVRGGPGPLASEWYGTRQQFDNAFTAMIDAILKEGGE